MILRSAHVRDFRSIEDSGAFQLSAVTALVGKNESGKTALLSAIEKINAANPARAGFTNRDYPRRKWRPDRAIPKDPPALWTKWELTDEEREEIEETFSKGALKEGTVEFTKSYDNQLRCTANIDERAIVKSLVALSGVTAVEKEALGLKEWTLAELLAQTKALATKSENFTKLQKLIADVVPEGRMSVLKAIGGMLPKVLYFSDYQRLSGQVSLNEYIQKKGQNNLGWGEQIFEALLALAGTTPENVQKLSTFEELNASLRAVSNQISQEIFEYWSQNKHLDVTLRFDAALPNDPAPFNTGYVFRTRIDNRRHGADTSFDDRSSGFVWFFSFLVWFSQLKARYGGKLLILLDEPGLTLHARAQADLLRYFREKLKPFHQVIYSTHSPFMTDPLSDPSHLARGPF